MMFDTIKPINVSHKNFKNEHNEITFDTVVEGNQFKAFAVFNGELYCLNKGSDIKLDKVAQKMDFTGKLNLGATVHFDRYNYVVEYEFSFVSGQLSDVLLKREDMLAIVGAPDPDAIKKLKNKVCIILDISDLDEGKSAEFIQNMERNKDLILESLRNSIGDSGATIIYPKKSDEHKDKVVYTKSFQNH